MKKTHKSTINTSRHAPYAVHNVQSVAATANTAATLTATLTCNGTRVARLAYCEAAGHLDIKWQRVVDQYRFLQHMAQIPEGFFEDELEDDDTATALFLIEMIDEAHCEKWLRRRCKTATLFRLKGDPGNEWRCVQRPYSREVAVDILAREGARLEVIENQRLDVH